MPVKVKCIFLVSNSVNMHENVLLISTLVFWSHDQTFKMEAAMLIKKVAILKCSRGHISWMLCPLFMKFSAKCIAFLDLSSRLETCFCVRFPLSFIVKENGQFWAEIPLWCLLNPKTCYNSFIKQLVCMSL